LKRILEDAEVSSSKAISKKPQAIRRGSCWEGGRKKIDGRNVTRRKSRSRNNKEEGYISLGKKEKEKRANYHKLSATERSA